VKREIDILLKIAYSFHYRLSTGRASLPYKRLYSGWNTQQLKVEGWAKSVITTGSLPSYADAQPCCLSSIFLGDKWVALRKQRWSTFLYPQIWMPQ